MRFSLNQFCIILQLCIMYIMLKHNFYVLKCRYRGSVVQ